MERKAALVTGSSHGIGYATALELARHGYDIGITYRRRKEGAQNLQNEIRKLGANCVVIKSDISDLDKIEVMFDEFMSAFGKIDLLVNNAGIGLISPFLETTPEIFDELTNTDWRGSFFSAQRAAIEMVSRNTKGVIINISSNHADSCWPDASVYAATKAALTKFAKNCALELAPYGIRVLTIQPGYTDIDWGEGNPIYLAKDRIPLKRFAETSEIAHAVVFLASEKAAYITGTTLTIDGGALLACVPENMFM